MTYKQVYPVAYNTDLGWTGMSVEANSQKVDNCTVADVLLLLGK